MTLIFDLFVIAFLLSVAFICFDWAKQKWATAWDRTGYIETYYFARCAAVVGFLLAIYNGFYGLLKVWFTIEGLMV